MSNTKHFADLMKVCSILPALLVMPAVAEVNVVEGTGEPVESVLLGDQYQNGGRIWLKNFTDGKYTHDTEKHTLVLEGDKDGKITLSSASASIQSHKAEHAFPSVSIVGDKDTVLNIVTQGEDWNLFSRFAPLTVGSKDSAIGTINLVNESNEGSLIYVTAGNEYDDAVNQKLEIYGDNILMKSVNADKTLGVAIRGNEGSLDLVANENLDVTGHIYGYNEIYGGHSDMQININQNEGNTAKTTIVGDINAAKGTEVNIGLKGTESSITGDMLVSAEGSKLPGGMINLQFGNEGSITGNITAQDKGAINITADDDFAINGKVFATATDSLIDIQGLDIDIESETDAVLASQGATINVGTEGATEIEIESTKDGRGARADYASTLNIGGADTDNVDITTGDNYAVMAMYANSKVNIKGKNINLSNSSSGAGVIHAGTSGIEENHDYATSPIVDINGENIFITNEVASGVGIGAMSQGVVNVEGNTTINAESVILARGEAHVNVNKSGKHTVKMDGNIDFNFQEKTSNSPVNANVDVTLAGADSLWTGNTIVSWDDVMPDKEKLVVSNAKLTMTDGAVWNASVIEDKETDTNGRRYIALNDLVINKGTVNIADTERGIYADRVVANDATFNGGALNVNEKIDITSGTTVLNNTLSGTGTLTLADGATLDIGTSMVDLAKLNINGTIVASVLNENSYGTINGVIDAGENGSLHLNVGSVGTYKIFGNDADIKITTGVAYDAVQQPGGTVVVTTKSVENLAADAGVSMGVAGAINSLVTTEDVKLQQISLATQTALNAGDIAVVEKELAKVGPEEKAVSHSVASSVQGQVLTVASGRMASVGGASAGRAGGEVTGAGVWAQGLFNKSKLNGQFHGYTRGLALGADTIIDDVYTIGAGYAYNNTDIHAAGRDTGVESNSVFVYGQYKPAEWFVNATLNYTTSEYADAANVFGIALDNEYDADAFGMQTMFGYDFENGVTPMAGMRYLHVSQDAHRDALGRTIKEMDTNFLSVVTGVNYAFEIENDWAVALRPELHAAMTYDVVSEGSTATIVVPGSAAYYVDIENLSRFGGEFGIGLTAEYRGLEVSLNYELDLHEDYTSQTGLLKFRYDF